LVIKKRNLGQVKLVQLQPHGLIIKTPSGYLYEATRRLEVEELIISERGIEATTPTGKHILDIHHLNHPEKAYDKDDLISIGFTSHYQAMREQFGKHMEDGVAGENIIIENKQEIWLEDLGSQIFIENSKTGHLTILDQIQIANPCEEFSHFAASNQDERLSADKLKATLQFLSNGRRGFLMLLSAGQEPAIIRRGDLVYTVN